MVEQGDRWRPLAHKITRPELRRAGAWWTRGTSPWVATGAPRIGLRNMTGICTGARKWTARARIMSSVTWATRTRVTSPFSARTYPMPGVWRGIL